MSVEYPELTLESFQNLNLVFPSHYLYQTYISSHILNRYKNVALLYSPTAFAWIPTWNGTKLNNVAQGRKIGFRQFLILSLEGFLSKKHGFAYRN